MTRIEIYFGDWVTYKGHSDVGYYLGTKFVQFICKTYKFDNILSFDIENVERLYINFLNREKIQSSQYIFFDVGTTLVDESISYDHRAKDMIKGAQITFDEFDKKRIELAKLGLNELGISNYFDMIIALDEVGVAKPNLEIFGRLIELVNLNPEDCIMVGL